MVVNENCGRKCGNTTARIWPASDVRRTSEDKRPGSHVPLLYLTMRSDRVDSPGRRSDIVVYLQS